MTLLQLKRQRMRRELMMGTTDREHWSRVASDWIEWARTPDHDAFWAYRDQLLAYIGRGEGEALDIGCGEGRISRLLKECGYRVAAADPVERFVAAAAEADSAHDYVVAAAATMPFDNTRFDLAVLYNVLMDLDDVSAALREARRVIRSSGMLFISIVHPLTDCGCYVDTDPDAPYVRMETYFGRRRFDVTEHRNGLRMHFAGWSQPLETYFAALEDAGLAITSMREPVPDIASRGDHLELWRRIPLFLWLKARPLPD
jgi:SAM-dependent methyltransferase